ncbi:hypothetical protein JZ751_023193 [Albula glossodonta]|uniref:Gem-associated protein 5 n=1 Tax=Albula glossodonta TaxID=121402 RepID=A0A8T2PMQ7_9TELE|nr:hypothetical protein JZ751_023193 [Albula glossodonta]
MPSHLSLKTHVLLSYKDGMIIVIDITKKNEVVHRLRGHDDEIHALAWCPEPNEELLHSRPEESSGLITLKLPFLKRRGMGVDPSIKERLWLTVHWPKGRPTNVVSSCFGGELIMWDLAKSGKQRWSLLGSSSDSQNHSRIVFNISSVRIGEDREVLISTSMDREIKCWDLSSLECCWTLPTLGGFVYTLSFSPVGTGCLALGVGDNMIRVWSTLSIQNKHDTRTFWQGIKSKVTALSWHPAKEGSLAFGTDDGKVGIFEAYSNRPPQISSTYHRKTVYTLAWGPPVPPMSFGGAGDKPSFSLYSCAGEGVIFQHDPWKLAGEATDIDKLIRDTNNINHKLSPHTELCWKPDGKVLAIGNEDGSIEVYQAPNLKLLCTIQQHHKILNVLRWHHEHGSEPGLCHLLASGSSNAIVYVHDLKSVIESPPENAVLITEAYRSLAGHTAKITSLAWSPHHDGRLVSVCYDGTAQVWDVLKDEALCNYRGHKGRLLCVQWSPVDPDLVWTGGDDFTVQEWAVSKQEHTRPPRGKKGIELEKKRASQQKAKAKKKKKASGKGGAKVEESESMNGEEERGGSPAGLSDNEEEGERGNCSNNEPTAWLKEPSRQIDRVVAEKVQNEGKPLSVIKKDAKEERKREKPEISMKKRKARSILPLSTSMDHRPKEDLQQDCLTLAAVRYSGAMPHQCVPGAGEHIQLGLFTDRESLYRMFQEEGHSHMDAGHYDSAIYLLLWKGDIAGALQMATEKGELTDHLVSISPMGGYKVWLKTVEAFVKQLCFQEQHLKAASYLLSIHKVYEAIHLLKSQQLYREAIALAKARLQPEDPVIKDLYTTWAAVLEKDGHYSTAAKCYLAADSAFDAAKVIAKKGDMISLKTAAKLAGIVGENELSHSLSLRCAKELMSAEDWLGAREVLRTQESLLGHQALLCTNELLIARLPETGVVRQSSSSTPSLSEPCGDDFLTTVKSVWQRELGISSSDLDRVRSMHQQLKAIDVPDATPNILVNQLLYHVSLHITMGLQSCLLGEWGVGLEELLGGVARFVRAGHFSLMSETCSLLFPEGRDSILQYKGKLEPSDKKGLAATESLEAFVCYRQLYELWWRASSDVSPGMGNEKRDAAQSGSNTESQNSSDSHGSDLQQREDGIKTEVSVEFCSALLSEPHATLQATQRAVAEIQQKLASLVHQHSQAQEAAVSPGRTVSAVPGVSQDTASSADPAADPGQSNGTESLPSLIALVSEHNKKLETIPEHMKKYPFPDVIECCLVLLYMDRNSISVLECLKARALALLQKYGSTTSYRKASQRFLS